MSEELRAAADAVKARKMAPEVAILVAVAEKVLVTQTRAEAIYAAERAKKRAKIERLEAELVAARARIAELTPRDEGAAEPGEVVRAP
jgi:hypothetical protein